MIFNSSNIITVSLIAVFTLFSGAVANAQKPMSPDRSTVQVQDTAKVPLLSPNYDDETEHTPLDNILPLSPQAASLARYGEYPVSHATGIPDITIPIYEIKLGDFTLPISISYHASGIKVDDVASTVGLGWTLNAGGAVTRQVFGAPDLTGASNEYTDYKKVVEIRDEAKKNDTGTSMLRNLLYGTGGSNPYYPYDTQSDRYSYNFAGKNGMFRYSYTDNKFIPTDFSRMDIYGDTDIEGGLFRITDTNGYVYVFSCQEFSGVKSDENTTDVSAWYLTEIKTPKGDIEIKYEKAAIYTAVYGTEYVVTGTFGQTKYHGANRIDEGYEYEKADESRYYISQNEILYRIPVVSSITWNGGIVRFHYSNDRKDIWKTRLTDIAVINMFGDTIKTANFGNDSYWGGTEKNRRMMLRSLYLSETGEYEFNYNTAYGSLPNYRTLSKNIKFSIGNFFCYSDYWGYYNGRRDHCSIPKKLYRQVLYRYSTIPGDKKFRLDDFADRNPNLYYTKFGILTSITYPTGGQTLFEYENNDYDFGGLRIKSITSNGIERSFGYNTSRQMTDRPEQMMIYDSKGQPADTRRLHVGKRLTCTHTDYSYTGKPTKVFIEEYSVRGNSKSFVVSQIIENVYSKKTDKLLSTSISVNGKKETTQRFEYDDLGRIKESRRGNHAGAVSYDYNLHGWTTNIGSKDFHEELHYTDGVGTPCFNGNISSLLWSTSDYGQVRGYKFEYDGLDRLKDAVYGETASLSDKQNRYNEKVIEYTANGAMKRFQRRGRKDDGEYGKIDNLHIKLNGNQLLSVADDALPANKYSSFNFIDGANETVEYEYNDVGALTKDLNRGITIRYDNLDYPRRIDFKDGNSITYTYLPDGTLLSKEYGLPYNIEKEKVNGVIGIDNAADRVTTEASSLSDTIMAAQPGMILFGETEYSGNIIYRNGKLDKILFPGGYCTFDKEENDLPIFHYYTQDHLGNNRTVTNEDGTVEQIVHYYPFGGTFNDAGVNTGLQQYKYNGKELDRVAGLNTYDYGARQYFSALPVWDRVDPKCEEDYGVSPYAYCRNNPIRMFDNDGKRPGDFFLTMDAAAIDFGLFYNDNSIRENREYGVFIYRVTNQKGDIGYSYNFATVGDSKNIEASSLPNGHIPASTIHTHGASTIEKDTQYYDNEFSGIRDYNDHNRLKTAEERMSTKNYDIGFSNNRKLISYLVTPNGTLQKYDFKTGKIKVINHSMPSDKNDLDRMNSVQSDVETQPISNKEFLEIKGRILYDMY